MPNEPEPSDLLGVWRLERRVADLRTGQSGRITGSLELSQVATFVRWLERGRFDWDGAVYPVSRELHLVRGERGTDGWQVRFADGRAFHRWAPGEIVTHPCRADRYLGLIRVDRDCTRLRVLWDVTGPGKRQRILTRCRRSAEQHQLDPLRAVSADADRDPPVLPGEVARRVR